MKLGIEGKRALVTGSDSGVGKAIARTLAAEGVRLIVQGADRAGVQRTAAAIIGDGGCAETVVGDLSTAEGAAGVIAAVFAKGGTDILVNNARGSPSELSEWLSIPDEDWENKFAFHVMSAVRTTRAFVPAMRRKGWGRIINISSASVTAPMAAIADYQASAAALVNLTFSLARSLAGTGVTANVVSYGPGRAPGAAICAGRMNDHGPAGLARGRHQRGTMIDRCCGTEEISAAAALLVSTLSDSTTGTNLHVGGGEASIFHTETVR
ncbi:SDR family oxidoreductase [Sphingobium sp. HBC34]|uniref:SDR family oxidoreductase n=1 Tax=Sphingobium cyanobacteriorum TaxID=3063954 RepID=A0ABT8ZFY7_9SPHN|nr:SDR family oxidoreductase [Sphingobium sp. HBC34]MDO7833444.1 SDR family oxidoreductase [Sphingobium sp. HBC34]